MYVPIRPVTGIAAAGPELFSPVPKTATRMVLSRTLRRCLRYLNASVNSNSSFGASNGSLGFVYAFEEIQHRLRAASCVVDARLPWKSRSGALEVRSRRRRSCLPTKAGSKESSPQELRHSPFARRSDGKCMEKSRCHQICLAPTLTLEWSFPRMRVYARVNHV